MAGVTEEGEQEWAERYVKRLERRIEDAVQQWRMAIDDDGGRGGARESLRLLATEAKRTEEALLRDMLQFLWPYLTPPAKRRLAEVVRMNKFAVTLRSVAKQLREDSVFGLWAGLWPGSYSPRRSNELLTVPERPLIVLHPELERLPEMLEQYAYRLENKAHLLRQCAAQEPTENKYPKDCTDQLIAWVKQVTGKAIEKK